MKFLSRLFGKSREMNLTTALDRALRITPTTGQCGKIRRPSHRSRLTDDLLRLQPAAHGRSAPEACGC